MKSCSQALRCLAGLALVTGCASDPGPGAGGTDPGVGAPATNTSSMMAAAAAGGGATAMTGAKAPSMSMTAPAMQTKPGMATTMPGSAAPSMTAPTSSAGAAGGGANVGPDMTMASAGSGAAPSGGPASGAAGAMGGAAGGSASTGTTGAVGMPPLLPAITTTEGMGPWNGVVKVKNTPPGGWMIYPKDIGKDGVKHPLFLFGPGGGTTPDTYESGGMHWDYYGSYGFVIYVLPRSTGNGADMKAGLDWLIEQNDDMASPLYQKLDITKVCAAGHSQGSVTVFDFMPDDRVTTTINISGGSFDGMGPSHLKNDAMFLCGPSASADVAFNQCEGDFKNTTVPTYYTNIQGSDHLTSGRMGWPASVAWMLWHLAGQEEQWKKEFLEPTGKFQMGIFKSQIKNWQ